MNNLDCFRIIGMYFGEDELNDILKGLGIDYAPSLARGERDVTVVSEANGIELTFSSERLLDYSFRDYPEGALVVSNIFLHGTGNDSRKRFAGPLPAGLDFSMKEPDLVKTLGSPSWKSPSGSVMRWDSEMHCVSARLDTDGVLSLIGVQLPNKYTMKNRSNT